MHIMIELYSDERTYKCLHTYDIFLNTHQNILIAVHVVDGFITFYTL